MSTALFDEFDNVLFDTLDKQTIGDDVVIYLKDGRIQPYNRPCTRNIPIRQDKDHTLSLTNILALRRDLPNIDQE